MCVHVRLWLSGAITITVAIATAGSAAASPLPPIPPLPADFSTGTHLTAPVGVPGYAPLPGKFAWQTASAVRGASFQSMRDDSGTAHGGGDGGGIGGVGEAGVNGESAGEQYGGAAGASGSGAQAADASAEYLASESSPASGASSSVAQPSPVQAAGAMLEGPPIPLAPVLHMTETPLDRPVPGEAAATALTPAPGDDRPISLNLQQASLAAVFDAFARFTGLNIIVSERVRGTVSLRLANVRWRSAFDALLDAHGLAMARRGQVIWVAPIAELAERERLRFDAHARAAELEPLESRSFVLRYARAADLQRLLTGSGGQRVLSRRGSLLADPRTNLLFITDLPVRVAQLAELVGKLDAPSRQVLIEARIVEGDRGFSRNLGARLALRATDASDRATGIVGNRDGGTLTDLTARPVGGFAAASAGLTLFAARASRLLDVELSALESEGRGQIVSSPRVVTADRTRAVVEQGAELPYQAKVGQGVSGVQFRRATLKLEVEPQITPDGRVILDLDIAKDSVGEDTASGPAINTKHVQTRVEVENGGTVSIGGIYASDDRDDVTRVPLLGKIPVLGALFRHRALRAQRSELVVYITPTVVIGP
ncbi:type IV pilus secretin PilQ [Burkholderia sp. TSV86]|uniref:type IV pilus secretin PilQ n=1 Tax=Burkholderia sp. TSV86 TaxID=1385594 RepID=UPI00075216D2|nr:type IV pilus secretin PilQ [Burkholderia sp. TSV86]KVE36010.1 secretin [Burkholderia sp. TSV86]